MKTEQEIQQIRIHRLKKALQEAGMTQKELAVKTGYTPNAISQYTTGKNKKWIAAEAFAQALNVRAEWLRGEDNVKKVVSKGRILKRFERVYSSFKAAGFELEQISGGVCFPDDSTGNETFIIGSHENGFHKCNYAQLVYLMDQLEAVEKALIGSFVRSSEPVTPQQVQSIKDVIEEELLKEFD